MCNYGIQYYESTFQRLGQSLRTFIAQLQVQVQQLTFQYLPFRSQLGVLDGAQTIRAWLNFLMQFSTATHLQSNFDFRSQYVFHGTQKAFEQFKSLILINLFSNLRLDSPLFNLILRKLVLKNHVQIFSLGSLTSVNYYLKELGINLARLHQILQGKH